MLNSFQHLLNEEKRLFSFKRVNLPAHLYTLCEVSPPFQGGDRFYAKHKIRGG